MSTAGIQLFVGLGNPGAQYEQTRHNAGAWFIDEVAKEHQLTLKPETKFHGAIAKLPLPQPCYLLKPSTYMNESGRSIAAVARFYKIPVEAILIAHDELDFEPGTIRLKHDGGHGGHNGLRDSINHLHSKAFTRLRIGIGRPARGDVTPFVLSKPSASESTAIYQSIDEAQRVMNDLIEGKQQQAFQTLHSTV